MKTKFLFSFMSLCFWASNALDAAETFEIRSWPPAKGEIESVFGAPLPVSASEAYQFVANEIDFQIYEGALRGVRGALLARSANAIDKSLLLAALLNHLKIKTRIVEAALSEAETTKLIALFEQDERARIESLSNQTSELNRLLEKATDPIEIELYENALKQRKLIQNRLQAFFDQDRNLLSPLLENLEKVNLANKTTAEATRRLLASRHYWVQAEIDGKWIDFDPSLKLGSGTAIATPSKSWNFEDVPREWFHSITLRIDGHYQQRDERRSQLQLEIKTDSASLYGRPLFLVHPTKTDGFGGIDGLSTSIGDLFGGKAGGINHVPVVVIDSKPYVGKVLKIPAWQGSIFDPVPAPSILAEVLTFETKTPSGKTTKIERPIFDLVGLHQRLAAAPATSIKQLHTTGDQQPPELQRFYLYSISSGPLPEGYLEKAMPTSSIFAGMNSVEELEAAYENQIILNQYDEMVRELDPSEEIVRDAEGNIKRDERGYSLVQKATNPSRRYELQPSFFVPPQARVALQFHSFQEGLRAQFNDHSLAGYIAEPNIVAFFIGTNRGATPEAESEAETISTYLGVDLISTSTELTQSGDRNAEGLFQMLTEQIFTEILDLSAVAEVDALFFTAHNTLAKAMAEGIEILTIKDATDPRLQAFPEDIRKQIEPKLADFIVLIPARPVDFYGENHWAWFLIDRKTLELEDSSDLFFSQAITEKMKVDAQTIIDKGKTACMYRQCLQAALSVANDMVNIVRGRVSLEIAQNLVTILRDKKSCSGKVKLRVKAPAKWKDKEALKKLDAIKETAKRGKLKTPKRETYEGQRGRDPAEFSDPPYTPATKPGGPKKDWDHRVELACGGKHESENVFAFNRSLNRSIGAIVGKACALLCEGTTITDIIFDWVTP